MRDIGLFIQNNIIDLKIENGDLAGDEGLETAALISLFTDQRIRDDEIPQGETSKRGWWGDMFTTLNGDKIGSKLWLFDREKITLPNLALIEQRAAESLAWMLNDGVANSIAVTAVRTGTYSVQLNISITRPSGTEDKFSLLWDSQSQRVS